MPILTQNKKVFHDYSILEQYEAGIVLNGQEVKSLKTGRGTIQGSYVQIKNKEIFLIGAIIPPYQPANAPEDYDPKRDRKLLLQKKEINKLLGKKQEKGLTVVPLKIYTKDGLIKIQIALAKGKKRKDKREEIKKREAEREIRRTLKRRG